MELGSSNPCCSRVNYNSTWHSVGFSFTVVVVQLLSYIWLFAIPWTAARQAFLSSAISWSLLRFMSIESVKPSNHLILCRPPSPPALNLSQHQSQLFASGGQSIGVSASASVFSMDSGLISFRIDRFDFLVLQRTLKSPLQHHNSKASILRHFWSNSHILFIFIFLKKNLLGMPWSLWYPCSLARDWIWVLISESPNHWTAREFPYWLFS